MNIPVRALLIAGSPETAGVVRQVAGNGLPVRRGYELGGNCCVEVAPGPGLLADAVRQALDFWLKVFRLP